MSISVMPVKGAFFVSEVNGQVADMLMLMSVIWDVSAVWSSGTS